MLGVVLEQGVDPGGTIAGLLVGGVRADGSGTAPDGGVAGGVGDEHLLAEQLGDQAGVGSLGTASAGAGELKQRLVELRTLDGDLGNHTGDVVLLADVLDAVVESSLLSGLALLGLHLDGLGRADRDALAAAHAVQRRHSDGELVLAGLGLGVGALQALGGLGQLVGGQAERTDGGMRADEGTVVALNALGGIPFGHHDGGAALLVSGSAQFPFAVGVMGKGGNRQAVAVHTADGLHDLADHLDQRSGSLQLGGSSIGSGVVPALGHLDLVDSVHTGVDGLPVHLDNGVALLAVALLGGGLHVLDGLVDGHDVSQLEEGGLQDRVGALAHADLDGLVDGVDGVQLDVVVGNVLLVGSVQVLIQLLVRPLAVDHEDTAGLDVLHHLHAHVDVGGVVAGHEVGLVDVVGAADGLVAETQMADGHTAGLLGVVLEVRLDVLVGVVADDLGGVLVGADGAVTAQTPELALLGAGGGGDGRGLDLRQAEVGHIVHDADGEAALGGILGQLGVHSEDAGRRGVLAAQAVTAAGQHDVVQAGLTQSGGDIQVEGLAQRAGLLGAVEDRDLLDGLGQDLEQGLGDPGTVQAHEHQADLLTLGGQVVDDFLGHVADGTHGDDDAVSVLGAVVVEQVVVGADLLVDLVHVLLDHRGQGLVSGVAGLTMLEEDVAVLMGAAGLGMLGVQRLGAELGNGIHVAHFLQIFVVPLLDLLDLMRSTETVEEVHEGNTALDGRQVRHGGQVHDFLRVGLGQHGEAGLTGGVNVAVVTEDVQGLGSNGTGTDVEDAGELLGCDLVHVGDHQQQALGCGEGGGDGTGTKRTVHSTGSTGLRLHLHNLDLVAEDVLQAGSAPLVHRISHGAGRSDGVDGSHIGERIGYVRRSGIAVHRLFCSGHFSSSIFKSSFAFCTGFCPRTGPRLSRPMPVFCPGHTAE